MSTIRAVVVTPDAPARLGIGQVPAPQPGPSEALVRVAAVSLNRGEVRRAQSAHAGELIGWDLAGVVERAAADGSGPAVGARVTAMMHNGAWAELVAVPTHALAVLPDAVSFAQAATLPIAGLTALHALELGGSLLRRQVLITGASGGVGYFAVQIARDAGAHVVAQVRHEDRVAFVREAGADVVVVGEDIEPHAPYYMVVDGVGGPLMAHALVLLAPYGWAVSFGATAAAHLTFDLNRFYSTGGRTLYSFMLSHELRREPARVGLDRLLQMVVAGTLRPHIAIEAGWEEVGAVAKQLIDRTYTGKAVLHIPGVA